MMFKFHNGTEPRPQPVVGNAVGWTNPVRVLKGSHSALSMRSEYPVLGKLRLGASLIEHSLKEKHDGTAGSNRKTSHGASWVIA
jgi:hypothetical protein